MLTFRLSHPTSGDKQAHISQDDLSGEGVTIGRGGRNHIVLEDPSVSRLHARLTLSQGSVYIADCGSTAGTMLNRARLMPNKATRLVGGDVLEIGPFTINLIPAEKSDSELLGVTVMAPPPLTSYMPVAAIEPSGITRWTGGELTVRVARIIDETVDAKTFVFVADKPLLFTYLPGQFITVQVPIDGAQITRSYTISSTPSRPHSLSITVKRLVASDGNPAGMVSSWLHAQLAVGDAITINGPYGEFSCVRHPSPRILLISAGSGITPMLAMSRWLTDTTADVDVAFLHHARSSAELICRQDLELLAVHNPRLRVTLATTRPEAGSRWTGLSGRISAEMLKFTVPDFHRREVFCCGPEPFMHSVKCLLEREHFPLANFHEERFGAPTRRPSSGPFAKNPGIVAAGPTTTAVSNAAARPTEYGLKALLRVEASHGPHPSTGHPTNGVTRTALKAENPTSVNFTKSKAVVACAPQQTVLEAGESSGIKLAFGCRMGKCGACKQIKCSGDLLRDGYDDAVLQASERSRGYILTCIAKPSGRVEIDA